MGSLPQPGGLRWSVRPDGTAAAVADGAWTVAHIATLDTLIEAAGGAPGTGSIALDLQGVSAMDTFGACLLDGLIGAARTAGRTVAVSGPPMRYQALLDAVAHADAWRPVPPPKRRPLASVEALGRGVSGIGNAILVFLAMLGAVGAAAARVVVHPRRFRFTSMVHQLDRVGFQAIPIIVLITLLIGAIIAQQGIFNFRKFGAESYVVDLVGILVLRELGVLVVAIMVAGRSGSSYTAELGSMKMREEIDALRVMGLDPVEVLIVPRVLALVIGLPILSFLSAMAALTGGALVAWIYGDIPPDAFLARLKATIAMNTFLVGLIKAPFMALVIGVISSIEGVAVEGSAESLGHHVTSAVVKSIFMVIVLDGFFAVFFAAVKY